VKLLDSGWPNSAERRGATRAKQGATFGATTQDGHLTSDGVALGTVAYMSPEQIRGQELDERTDLFSLGLVLYEMSTGQRAFSGNNLRSNLRCHFEPSSNATARLNPAIPVQLEQIIAKAAGEGRELRYRSAATCARIYSA